VADSPFTCKGSTVRRYCASSSANENLGRYRDEQANNVAFLKIADKSSYFIDLDQHRHGRATKGYADQDWAERLIDGLRQCVRCLGLPLSSFARLNQNECGANNN
jgi:hypothetical protein